MEVVLQVFRGKSSREGGVMVTELPCVFSAGTDIWVCVYVCVQAGACTSTTPTMRCPDDGDRDSALAAALMNDLTFVLVAGKNLEGRATARNNAALVNLPATQALVRPILGNSYPPYRA